MIQSLESKITINIPEELILLDKVTYQELLEESDRGKVENFTWFRKQVGIENGELAKERILYPYRKELESFVRYPNKKGEPWRFHKNLTKQWIENNFDKIVGR